MTKSPIPLLHDQTCDNKGNSDIGYSIGTRRGIRSISRTNGLRRRGGVIGLNVSTCAKAPIDTPNRRHSNSNFFIYQIRKLSRSRQETTLCLSAAGTGTDASPDTSHDIAQDSDQRGIADHFEPLYPRERRGTEYRTSELHDQHLSDGNQQQHQEERTASPQIVQHRMTRFETFGIEHIPELKEDKYGEENSQLFKVAPVVARQ